MAPDFSLACGSVSPQAHFLPTEFAFELLGELGKAIGCEWPILQTHEYPLLQNVDIDTAVVVADSPLMTT
jgi:hypothetical protein